MFLCQRCRFVLTAAVGGGPTLYVRVESRNRALGASTMARHLATKYADIILTVMQDYISSFQDTKFLWNKFWKRNN